MSGNRGDTRVISPPPPRSAGRLKQSQDGYKYGQNTGAFAGNQQSPPKLRNVPQMQDPDGKVVLGGYRQEIEDGFEEPTPRYNPMNSSRPQSSMLLNVNDPIQVHLLVETALDDSKEFELLSQEEVDDLKKQVRNLEQRIDQTRQTLAIQSKYRDAAISMGKLYSPGKNTSGGEGRSRRSLLGLRNSHNDQVDQADHEREASERKCQDLAVELWKLEKRLMEPQRRLLQHTAGILQMTHKGPAKGTKGPDGIIQAQMPGSPESMFTYNNGRSSIEAISESGDLFDERSLYRTFDRLDGLGLGRPESFDGLRSRSPGRSEQLDSIAKTEQKLEDLNSRLREVIVKANSKLNSTYEHAPGHGDSSSNASPGTLIPAHLDYLEQGIRTLVSEQLDAAQERQRLLETQQDNKVEMEQTMQRLNSDVRALLLPFDPSWPDPPQVTGKGFSAHIEYFQSCIDEVGDELQQVNAKKGLNDKAADGHEAVLIGLWDTIQSGEEDIRQRKAQARLTRSTAGLPDDEDSLSDDELMNSTVESFHIQAFNTKVQSLFFQATSLRDQKKVLQRQIKQQRELNSKDNGALQDQLKDTEESLQTAEGEVRDLQSQLQTVMQQLDRSRRESTQRGLEKAKKENEESTAVQALEQKLVASNDAIAQMEEELQDMKDDRSISDAEMQSRLTDAQTKVNNLMQQLKKAEDSSAAITAKEQEIEERDMRIAELTTEVTIARAELDGAYGTRAQRAAEVAANPAIQKEIDDLTSKNREMLAELDELKKNAANGLNSDRAQQLQKELSETIEEYEIMTKASIEWEKERENLENQIDKLRDEKEGLESKLSDEQVKWLGMKSPGGPPTDSNALGAGSTSTTVLKNEFKKMMRDTRAENMKSLRAEQAERRKLEEEIRALKKAQGPGKSLLSQSVGP